MKHFFTLLLSLTVMTQAKAQLDRGIWLAGGTGKFYWYNSQLTGAAFATEASYTQIDLAPSVGFFLLDKFAAGIRPTFSSIKGEVTSTGGLSTNVQRYWLGPFARYYVLTKEKPFNIVTDVAYQWGLFNAGGERGKLNTFSAMAGPVIFFNSSVGLEVLLGYHQTLEDVPTGIKEVRRGFQIGVGFQIHLER